MTSPTTLSCFNNSSKCTAASAIPLPFPDGLDPPPSQATHINSGTAAAAAAVALFLMVSPVMAAEVCTNQSSH